ncbi:uncharacterized protein EV422DRAFT_570013 [Fimicolochytrium jonesii]|uniref:uncharacterized protein n=1 Tax=Fimicolochytrium jonesii TaxID=1396493 RepID=UPI0022FE3ABF|nr:uncharacterized protein EV422DRAFT_570013 [Fimicolochytrium jonesii]KAI8818237.1 hypothetical protein EV422DRAFT_570013 [Fimicolochytrium jonesii]
MAETASVQVARHANWNNFLLGAVAQFTALSVVRRGASLVLPSTEHFAVTSPSVFTFGYSSASVYSALDPLGGVSRVLLITLALVNFGLIAANAFNLSVLITLGLKTVGLSKQPVSQLNLLPLAAAALHAIENVLFLLVVSIPAHSTFLAGLAGTFGLFKDIIGLGAVAVVAATLPVMVFEWVKAIGNDGRQRVEIKSQ